MYDNHFDNEYLETKVMTATPQHLHLMVVEGAIRFARQAKQHQQAEEWESAFEALNRSRDFVSELIGGLNPEQAPEMVDSLKQLFSYAYRNLAIADLERDSSKIDLAIRILEIHRETWLELLLQLPAAEMSSTANPAASDEPQTGLNWQG